jgi:hypothetical protein
MLHAFFRQQKPSIPSPSGPLSKDSEATLRLFGTFPFSDNTIYNNGRNLLENERQSSIEILPCDTNPNILAVNIHNYRHSNNRSEQFMERVVPIIRQPHFNSRWVPMVRMHSSTLSLWIFAANLSCRSALLSAS